MLTIYLLGCLIALIIEIITHIRLRQLTALDICFTFCVAVPSSWIAVIIFLAWVYSAMGWTYEDMKGEGIDPYIPIVWRLRRDE